MKKVLLFLLISFSSLFAVNSIVIAENSSKFISSNTIKINNKENVTTDDLLLCMKELSSAEVNFNKQVDNTYKTPNVVINYSDDFTIPWIAVIFIILYISIGYISIGVFTKKQI